MLGCFFLSEIDVLIPSFDGHSYLQFVGLRRSVLSFSEIEIVFKAVDPNGLLLYNGYSTDGTGDFISAAITNSTVEYRFDLGTGPAIIRFAIIKVPVVISQVLTKTKGLLMRIRENLSLII